MPTSTQTNLVRALGTLVIVSMAASEGWAQAGRQPANSKEKGVPFMQGPPYSGGTRPTVKFSEVNFARGYALEIYEIDTKKAVVQKIIEDAKTTEFIPEKPLRAGFHGARVRSLFKNKRPSEWSRLIRFFVDPDHDQKGGLNMGPQLSNIGDPWTEEIGTWKTIAAGVGGSARLAPTAKNQALASWVFKIQPGTFRVYATWVARPGNTPETVYTLVDGAKGRLKLSTKVDQSKPPPADLQHADANWKLVGEVTCKKNTLEVILPDSEQGNIVADAVYIVPVNPQAPKPKPPPGPDVIDIFAD